MIMALSPVRARQMCDEFLAGGVKKEVSLEEGLLIFYSTILVCRTL
jgi:hypothetical protein